MFERHLILRSSQRKLGPRGPSFGIRALLFSCALPRANWAPAFAGANGDRGADMSWVAN
jgi:hypothetical protein